MTPTPHPHRPHPPGTTAAGGVPDGQATRKHLRMQGWDFTSPGWYFLTLCTKNMCYIRDNPLNFDAVMHCGEPKYLGNKALLKMPKVGFLASRGQTSLHGTLPLKSGEAIISGFLSPMERAVFQAGLKHKRPMICVSSAGLNGFTACREAMEEGRLLIISPFDPALDAPSARRAVWCNQYVLAHCDRAVIGHLNPDGMLACILHEANPEKEITYL